MSERQAVSFENRTGQKLFGIFHPASPEIDKGICILLLSPGVKMRVAPHRLYNRMTKEFVELGFSVFRFDFYGLGDSEGELDEKLLADFYASVQLGRYIDDTLDAMQWVEEEFSVNRFIFSGLCGGAITGLLAGQNDPRVLSLLGLGIPVILDSSSVDQTRYLTQGQVERLKHGYIKKILDPKSWFRLITFQSNYLAIFKVLKQITGKNNSPGKKRAEESGSKNQADNTNPHFAPAFFNWMKQSKKIYFVFSGTDRLTWEFDEKFSVPYRDQLLPYDRLYDVYTVPEANHIFTFTTWYEDMMNKSKKWLIENY